MNINIIKKPEFENDSYLLEIKDFSLSELQINSLLEQDDYLKLKYTKFKNADVSKEGFEPFLKKRGSLRFFNDIERLYGSIYTFAVEDRHFATYQQVLQMVRDIFVKNPNSRKAVVRMANDIHEYRQAELKTYDVSCLNIIHYLNGQVNLMFRSSDIEYELYYDIITLYVFFMMPIYGHDNINIQIYGSTGQNVDQLQNIVKKVKRLENESN